MLEGSLAALDAIEQATGEQEVNVIGYCLGGTLLAATLAWMAVKRDKRIKAATFFATPDRLLGRRASSASSSTRSSSPPWTSAWRRRGYLEGRSMADTFNMLRANDLIWSFVINNYLMGKEPFPFDLLYWNSDCTRMPAPCTASTCATSTRRTTWSSPAASACAACRSTCARSACRSTCCRPGRTTSRPGASTYAATQFYRRPDELRAGGLGAYRRRDQPAGVEKYGFWLNPQLPPTPRTGSRAPLTTPARGGRTGATGTPPTPATRSPRGRSAPAT